MLTMRTAALLAGMTALFLGAGYMQGVEGGMLVAPFVAVAMNLFAYWTSDRLVLSIYGAREVDDHSAPAHFRIVESLATRVG